jgi:arylsulfate sulfotransferase
MTQIRWNFVTFLAAIFVVSLVSGCSSSNKPVAISPSAVALAPGGTAKFQLSENRKDVVWSVGGVAGGNSTVGTIDANGNYTAPSANTSTSVMVTATFGRQSSSPAQVIVVAPGTVAPTANPQVALYTIAPPADASVTIQFGQTTNYGLTTWTQPTPAGGGALGTFVAGMLANTTYHMQATVKFASGLTFTDIDHTFTTQALTAVQIPKLTATTTPGMTPQSGVEFLNLISTGGQVSVGVTDLAGNMLWGYNAPPGVFSNGAKLMPNGHFLINFNNSATADGANSIIQEVDLGGNVVWQLTAAQLNQALASATCTGCNITVVGTHHDFAVLPNGHLILIAAQQKTETGLTGFPDPVTVTGDVLIDLDQNHNPVWLWSEFDHLDVNRHPFSFPDWTHTNSVVYSPDDKALIISIRHQFWVVKIDYNNGQGTGNILWKLGFQGDFALQSGTDPIDWFYAQHDANVASTNSSGTFQLIMFDNGNNRILDTSGDVCGTSTPCFSRVPIMQLDESAKTATIEWVDNLSPTFSFFGGSAGLLNNGNVEFDQCAGSPTAFSAAIYEVTKTTSPQTVWQMHIPTQNVYRGFRMPSLYPGVQW